MKITINKQRDFNTEVFRLLAYVVAMPLLINFLGSIFVKILGTTTYSTYFVYGFYICFLLLFFLRYSRSFKLQKLLLLYICIAVAFFLNYMAFEDSHVYFKNNLSSLLIVLIVYVPVAYATTFIDDWSLFFDNMKWIAIVTPFIGLLTYYYLNITAIVTYMMFSQMILPGLLISWYVYKRQHTIAYLFLSLADLFLIIVFGGRMSLFSAILFIILIGYYGVRRSRNKTIITLLLMVVGCIIFSFWDSIIKGFLKLISGVDASTSYLINRLIRGDIFSSSSRENIYSLAFDEIKKQGLFGFHGLFGDRICLSSHGYVGDYTTNYVHNIFLEFTLSFGWIVGGVLSIALAWIIVKQLFIEKNRIQNEIIAFFVCYVFTRLLVSGSYLIDGHFALLLGVMLRKSKKRNKHVLVEE